MNELDHTFSSMIALDYNQKGVIVLKSHLERCDLIVGVRITLIKCDLTTFTHFLIQSDYSTMKFFEKFRKGNDSLPFYCIFFFNGVELMVFYGF